MKKLMRRVLSVVAAVSMVLLMALPVMAAQTENTTASIKIETDTTYNQDSSAYKYKVYKVFDATYISNSGKNTQDEKDTFDYNKGTNVSYFMADGNPWISTVRGLAYNPSSKSGYFDIAEASDKSGYTVSLNTNVNSDANTAKAIATALNGAKTNLTLAGDYAGIDVTAGSDAVSVQPGYYLIVGETNTGLALVTTNVTVVEKNEYPTVSKEFSDAKAADKKAEDDSEYDDVQVGDTVSYDLTIKIPSGANQEMIVTDTFTSGLNPVIGTDGKVTINTTGLVDGTSATASTVTPPTSNADAYFTVTISAADVAKNAGKTIVITYTAAVTTDAVYEKAENRASVKYGNDYTSETDKVDSETKKLTVNKTDGSKALKGAQFVLYRNDGSSVSDTKTAVKIRQLTDAELTSHQIEKANDTVYYVVDPTSQNTTIDMAQKDETTKEYLYSSAVVYGLDKDTTYSLEETKAPEGYNKLDSQVTVNLADEETVDVENHAGSALPSTGGMGTTIFYVLGAVLVIGAGVVLVTRRRVSR